MKSKLRILFVTPVNLSYPGGAERWLHEVSSKLSKKGYRISILHTDWVPHNVKLKKVEIDDVEIYKCRFVKPPFRGMPIVDTRCLLNTYQDYDVIYVNAYSPNELLLRIMKRFIRKPIIAGFHTMIEPLTRPLHASYEPLFLWGCKCFDAIHVLNNFSYRFFERYRFHNIYPIPNGVDTRLFRLCDSIHLNTFNILYTGRFTKDKGIDILVKIIYHVQKIGIPNIKFKICGFGPLRTLVEKVACKYDNVQYLNFVPKEELINVYQNAHLFLIPSRTEGMPLRLLEAQSCGLPVVGSKIPGISDVIKNGKNGFLTDVGNIKGFADAIKRYYELWRISPKEYYKLNRTIRENIVNNYDWDVIINRLENMFREF